MSTEDGNFQPAVQPESQSEPPKTLADLTTYGFYDLKPHLNATQREIDVALGDEAQRQRAAEHIQALRERLNITA